MNRQDLGRKSEDLALLHLRRLRHRVLDRNVHFPFGELDLVTLDRRTVVFTEVRAKTSLAYGTPEETIDKAKQNRIKKAAAAYLYRKGWEDREVRFDVVAMVWRGQEPEISYYKDAFR